MLSQSREILTSIRNPQIQIIRELLNRKSARDEANLFIVEGVRLAEEVLQASITPETVLFAGPLSPRGNEIIERCRTRTSKIMECSQDLLNSISDTETAQGILMVVPQIKQPLPESTDLVVILDQVRDPGNMGTILRTSTAAGVQVVFVPSGNADPYSPKVVRAGMGAHFRINIQISSWEEIIVYCKKTVHPALKFLVAESEKSKSMWDTNLREPVALIVGGEAEGASAEAKAAADSLIHIPMPGQTESLNAAVAAGIILFEIVRQRNQ